MLDKHSTWGYDNGLKSMIPTALVMGIVGYPFVLPDMIGGNGYPQENISDGLQTTLLPSKVRKQYIVLSFIDSIKY